MRKANNRRLVKVHLLSNPLMEADLDFFLQKVKISETFLMLLAIFKFRWIVLNYLVSSCNHRLIDFFIFISLNVKK